MKNIKLFALLIIFESLLSVSVSQCINRGCDVGPIGSCFCESPCLEFDDCCFDFIPGCVEVFTISWQTSFIEVIELEENVEIIIPITVVEDDGTALDADSGFSSFFGFRVTILEGTATNLDDVILTPPSLIFLIDDVTTELSVTLTILADQIAEADETLSLEITSNYGTVSPISTLQILIRDHLGLGHVVAVSRHELQGKKSTQPIHLYAISNTPEFSFEWSKRYNSDQPVNFLEDLAIDGKAVGFDLTIPAPKTMPVERLGYYTSTFISPYVRSSIGASVTLQSDCLNFSGRKTITVYPKEAGSLLLRETIRLKVISSCFDSPKVVWRRNSGMVPNGGRRVLRISTVTDARGVFLVSRRRRARSGKFALLEIIVSDCPEGYFKDDNGDCSQTCPVCKNNGVCDLRGVCQCPPCFYGPTCESARLDSFGVTYATIHQCSSLSPGRRSCKGVLFCYGNLYGCSCGCGWHGSNCAQRCNKGEFGADCLQQCHCVDDQCNPQTGECANGCKVGWTGFNCQDNL